MIAGRIAILMVVAGCCFAADPLSEALRSGRFQDALSLADSLLKTQPRDARIWTGRGIALAELGRDRDSVSSFEKALEFSPDFEPALKGAVEAGYRSRDPRTAELLDRLLRVQPTNEVANGMRGVLAFERGDCPGAVSDFEKARSTTAGNPQALSLYGACLVAVDRVPEAVPVFARLLQHDPSNPRARFNLGYAQVLARKYEDAVRTLEPMIAVAGADPDGLNLIAAAEAGAGRLESAVAHLQQAIRTNPRDEKNYLDLASLCMRNESGDTAAAIVDAGLENLPNSARLHTLRGILDAQRGRHDEAAAEFDIANRLEPNREYGSAGLGVMYTEMRQTDLASGVLRERIRKSPNDPTLNFLLAQALVQEGVEPESAGHAEALRALKIAVAGKPDLARAHTLLGKLYVQSGEDERAAAELRLAARYDPSDRMAFSQLAIALRRLGREQDALEALDALKRIIEAEARPKGNYKVIRVEPAPSR